MSNSYYNHTTYPTPNSPGSSATLRLELDAVTTGFGLLPTLAANGYKVAMVKPNSFIAEFFNGSKSMRHDNQSFCLIGKVVNSLRRFFFKRSITS